jgi:hypothetical protein
MVLLQKLCKASHCVIHRFQGRTAIVSQNLFCYSHVKVAPDSFNGISFKVALVNI